MRGRQRRPSSGQKNQFRSKAIILVRRQRKSEGNRDEISGQVPRRLAAPAWASLSSRSTAQLRFVQLGHVRQVAISVLIIEPVADDEHVGHVEADIIGHKRDGLTPLLAQRYSRTQRAGLLQSQLRNQGVERMARIEDIIDQQHVLPGNFRQQIEVQFRFARPGCRSRDSCGLAPARSAAAGRSAASESANKARLPVSTPIMAGERPA